jgi:2-polyprenyl-3-methyl-5-hydroxy-6-metoxy-1,4-benzoquinol methylase
VIDIAKIATNLEIKESGLWVSRNQSQVFYPETGNEGSFEIEGDSFWFEHRNNCILAAMQMFSPPGTVFDIGGGNGFVALGIKNAGIEVVLVEPGFEGVRNARVRGLTTIICPTLEDAGFLKHTIPAIGIFDVLEHIEDDTAFLNTLRSLLVQGGRIYITVPAYDFLWSIEDDFTQHHRRYTTQALSAKLKKASFAVEFATYIFAFLPIPIFFARTIPSKLRIKKAIRLENAVNQHENTHGLAGRLLSLTLDTEIKALKKKRTIPFGGSCLVVARAI